MADALIPQEERPAVKSRAALLSVGSNTLLILLKVVAGTVTGSVSILSEAMHSAVDLIASIVAFFSIRKADEPADEDHPWGTRRSRTWPAIEGCHLSGGDHRLRRSGASSAGRRSTTWPGMAVIGF